MKERLLDWMESLHLDKKKLLYIGGGALLAVLVLIIVLTTALGGGRKQFDKLYKEAEAAYLARDYVTAEEKLQSAMELKSNEDSYLLMAEIYTAQGETDRAIELLYLGYSRVGGDKIAEKLETLKAERAGGAGLPASQGAVTVAGVTVDAGAASLVLSGNGLSSSDRAAIATLTGMESLSISDCGVSDLSFLSGLRNLTLLQVADNAVRDLSPLSGLSKLKTLYIDRNPITDFTPLYGLSSLRTLSMKGIDVSDAQLEALAKALPNCKVYADRSAADEPEEITLGGRTFRSDVTELNLGGLGITDISALSACTELETLDLRDNKITDISPLVDLQNLKWLCIWNNQVEDIYPLLSLRQLEYFDADSNKISDISVLEYLEQLQELWLNDNPLKSVEPLRSQVHLIRLGLAGTGLDDDGLDCLLGMTELKELNLKRNEDLTAAKFEELQAVIPDCVISHDELRSSIRLGDQEFPNDAEEIIAASLELEDISALAGCKSLRVLNLTSNRITDLGALSGLAALEELYLSNNRISDLSPLAGCTRLKTLYISGNRISDLAPLAACAELKELHLGNNAITDISALASLAKLETLQLDNNRISDLSALYGLSRLTNLSVRGNGLTADDILALQTMLPNCVVMHDVALTPEDIKKQPGAQPLFPSSGSDLR